MTQIDRTHNNVNQTITHQKSLSKPNRSVFDKYLNPARRQCNVAVPRSTRGIDRTPYYLLNEIAGGSWPASLVQEELFSLRVAMSVVKSALNRPDLRRSDQVRSRLGQPIYIYENLIQFFPTLLFFSRIAALYIVSSPMFVRSVKANSLDRKSRLDLAKGSLRKRREK